MLLPLPKKTTAVGKVRLLLWKNFLIQKRHYFQTFFDLLLPVLFFLCYVLLYKHVGYRLDTKIHAEKTYSSHSIDNLNLLWDSYQFYSRAQNHRLIFSPNNTVFTSLMNQVSEQLDLNEAIGVMNSGQLDQIIEETASIAAIDFHHPFNSSEVPKNLAYSLRFPAEIRTSSHLKHWETNLLYSTYAHITRYIEFPEDYYDAEGFLAIQNAIAKAFVNITSNHPSDAMPEIRIQRFPSPEQSIDIHAHSLRLLTSLFLIIFLCFSFMNTVRLVSTEKEKQLKESMKIMGLASWLHYLGWFIRTIVMLSISMVLITILLTIPCFGAQIAIFPNTSFLCMVFFFIGYCICLITFSFMICACCSKSKSAVTAAMALWFVTSAPFLFGEEEKLSAGLKIFLCICPNTALGYGLTLISDWELINDGLNWHTAFQQQNILVHDNLTVATVFGLFIAYAILFFLITVYVENVFPGAYGVAKPWYFIFTKKFWQNFNNYSKFDEHFELVHSNGNPLNFENEPVNQPIGIEIKNLTKKFMSDTAVVSNLSMNIYYDQITSLLGHNGAGKTTTISMLTGMMEPTSGTALINGYDIRRNMDSARGSMGFCPQHNILFDELTVREHILFYCSLKGLSNEAAESEARKYVQLLELEGKENALSSTLSGGMKRKLSVVIALCGQSKVVFLDEPTSGMDPGARRALWDILLAEKKDRTILLTTHFMDEADVLSDRIAILADGELKCTGSTFFLKKRFSTGYHLICAKDRGCDSRLITELLRKYISDIRVDSENETEVTYILPEERTAQFTTIFNDLENNELRLNVESFGVSLTTIEEIFLKIGKSETVGNTLPNGIDRSNGSSETQIMVDDNRTLLHGSVLWKNQAIAMLKKRYLCWMRAFSSFLLYNLFVMLVISMITFSMGYILSKEENLPPLDINLDKYTSPIIVLQEPPNLRMAKQYEMDVNKTSAKLKIIDGMMNMQTILLALAQSSVKDFKVQYLTAASFFDNNTIIAWFNNHMIHSAPLALDLVHNAIIKTLLSTNHSIHVTNAPLRMRPSQNVVNPDFVQVVQDTSFEFLFPFTIYILMSILVAKYTSFYIEEKQCNAKFLQYVSGVRVVIFWGVSILWDLMTSTITIILIILMLIFGQQRRMKSFTELAVLFLILFVYNFAMIPVICLWSLIFSKPSYGKTVVSIFNVIIVPTLFLLYFLINILTGNIFSAPFDYRHFILWPYPLLTMFDSLVRLQLFQGRDISVDRIFSRSHIGIISDLEIMVVTGIVAFAILIGIELGGIRIVKSFLMKKSIENINFEDDSEPIDDDVLAEKKRINQMTSKELQSEAIVMQNISKRFDQFYAVKNVSLSIKRGECFGLLGKNGAGKTTIFKMLTGELTISAGEIFTYGFNQKYQLNDIYKMTGYCPQFDALLTNLTCRETLEIFALVRGIPVTDVKEYVENSARNLDFIQHIDKRVDQLSGGNKRKLSASLAIIGNLNVIFLDEPTTGLDPATKRNLWDVVIQSRESGKSIVLTSHSMEECEALCTQITVLVNGKCKCLGSSQHLKDKFSKGFELRIKIKPDQESHEANLDYVKNFVSNTFNGAIFRGEYQGLLSYSVPSDTIKWSSVFGIMENAKKTLNIEDYSISQNSLELAVLKLLNDQTDQNQINTDNV